MKKLLAVALAGCMTVSLAACGGNDKAADNGGDGAEGLNVCFASEPATIDPALSSAVDSAIIISHAFEGLVKWADDGEGNATLAPGMAEEWDVEEDGTLYTFHLREDATWSDGEPVTAHDFVYAWNRLADPATAADYSYMLDPVVGFDSTVEGENKPEISAPDDHTFVVKLDVPTSYFEEVLAFPALFPVREDVIEANGDNWTFTPDTYVCNGPYKLSDWSHNESISLVKRDDYYNADEIVNPSLTFSLMDDDNAILAGRRSGELDFIQGVPPQEIPALLESGELKIEDYIGTYYTIFNTQKAPFDDPNIRKAFSLAIDRNHITEVVKGDGSVPAGAFVPEGMYDAEGPGSSFREVGGDFISVDKAQYEANCEEARKILADAGYPGGEGFPTVEYLYNTNEGHKAIGESLKDMWEKELGVTVSLQNQDWNVFLEERKQGNFSIARGGWIADYNDPMCFLDMFVTGGGNNDPQYANPEYDALIGQAKNTGSNEERMKLMHDAETHVMEQSVVAPIYYYVQPYMENEDLTGWYYTPLGFFFFGGAHK